MNHDKLRQDIVLSDHFRFDRPKRQFAPGAFLSRLNAPSDAIEECFRVLHELGWVQQIELWNKHPGFEVSALGFRGAEDLRRTLGRRHPALTSQGKQSLDELLLALAACASVEAGHALSPGTLGNGVSFEMLYFLLNEYDQAEIDAQIGELRADHLVHVAERFRRKYLCVSERGFATYMTERRFNLGLGPEETILDELIGETADVFFAFQSEYGKSRRIIGESIDEVIEHVNSLPGLVRQLRVVTATEAGDGGVRIDSALLEKIKRSPFFLGDVTPVEVSANRKRIRINDCVLVELGYALAGHAAEDIVLLSMNRSKDDGFPGKDDEISPRFPFDIDHMRRLHFASKDECQRMLRTEFVARLKKRGWIP